MMPILPALLLSLLLWAPTVSGGHGVLRKQQQMRPFKQDPKNPKPRKSPRRQLQRAASICADNPTPFSTSMYVSLVGDGTPFREEDADTLLRMVLRAFNQADANSCDPTYRTLSSISVGEIFYTDSLDFIRLRMDVDGSCGGCLPNNMESGVGPLFGGAEQPGVSRRALLGNQPLEEEDESNNPQEMDSARSRRSRGIKGGRSNRQKRNLQKDDTEDDKEDKDKNKDDDDKGSTGSTGTGSPGMGTNGGGPSGNPDNSGSGGGTANGGVVTGTGTNGGQPTQVIPGTAPPGTNGGVVTGTTTGGGTGGGTAAPGGGTLGGPGGTPWTGGTQGTGTFPPGIAAICGCNAAPESLRGPTPSEFGFIMNAMIETARADNTLSGVSFIEDLFEASVVGRSSVLANLDSRQVVGTCAAANNQEFTSTLWLEITPTAPTILDLPEAEMLPLEVAIMEAFNEIMLLSCDVPFFRIVTDVAHQETRQSGDKLQLRFDVIGKCVNCDPNTITLFDDTLVGDVDVVNLQDVSRPSVFNVTGFRAPSRSLLTSEVERLEVAQAGPVIVQREETTSCTCPLNVGDLPLRSPTSVEFTQVLRTAVETLTTESLISSIQEVVRVKEGEIDSVCSADVISFTSAVLVDFQGEPQKLSSSEISTLEGGFEGNYNELIFNSCDEYFRTVVDVRLIPGIARRRLGLAPAKRRLQATTFGNAGNSSDVSDLQSEAPSVYMVTGQCRGCPRSSTGAFSLFDDGFRFRKLMEDGKTNQATTAVVPHYASIAEALQDFMSFDNMLTGQRRLQDCACPPGTEPDSPSSPSVEELRVRYNQEIVRYNEVGSVVNVQEVTAMIEASPFTVPVGFSMFYGTLANLGETTEGDYVPLVAQTAAFYRKHLLDYYNADSTSLRVVNIAWEASTRRVDLSKLQVDFMAELIFEESALNIPTVEQATAVMNNLDYVEYITQYIWRIDESESVFRQAHSVRFAGREDVLVDTRLLFTVGSARTNQSPNIEDRSALRQQVALFFLDVLRAAGLQVVSFTPHIDAEDIQLIQSGSILVDFDATIVFYSDVPAPPKEEITAILRSADLEVLRTQYLNAAGPVGTGLFTGSFGIVFDSASP